MRVRLILPLLMLALISSAIAKVPNRTPEELEKGSSDIVKGKVVAIYSFAQEIKPGDRLKYTRFVAEILVEKSSKGKDATEGEVLYAKYYDMDPVGEPMPHGGGHDLPEVGKSYTVHLERGKDGSFSVLHPNGFVADNK